MLNPVNIFGSAMSWGSNWLNGFHFSPSTNPTAESVVFHAPVISKISIGQETDIASHQQKYESWLQRTDKTANLILYGVSRGTAATFCAFAKYKYPEVKLVILEGAIDSIANILPTRAAATFYSSYIGNKVVSGLNSALAFFTQYRPDGVSPLACVNEYPENVPTVFITSALDAEVPCENTHRIATALANRGKNDVYLLKLKRSSHPNYMFDDLEDRNNYEAFIHAIYAKYNLQHDPELAQKGESLLSDCTLFESEKKRDFAPH